MKGTCLFVSFCLFSTLLKAAYDSALAPYPQKTESFDQAVEEILSRIEANAPAGGAFSAAGTWLADPACKLDLDRNHYGPLSLKSALNWHLPHPKRYWEKGSFKIMGLGSELRIEKEPDAASPGDWWHKQGDCLFSRRWSEDWPVIWRFHHDLLEAGALAYPEGLGLLLWAFQPGEFLRRAQYLEVGEDREFAGRLCKTLVSTPGWIKTPPYLRNRTSFPFNESTLASWAQWKPQITYFIDPEKWIVTGARFTYFKVLRSGPKDWTAKSKPSGLVVTCAASEIGRTEQGTFYPAATIGEVWKDEKLLRRTVIQFTFLAYPQEIPALKLPDDKRMIDPWPPYQVEVYKRLIATGDDSYATRLGLAKAFAYEGYVVEAEQEMIALINALEKDDTLIAETFGGIDWELGFALYELFWRFTQTDLDAFWARVPRTHLWSAVTAKAVDLYRRFRPREGEKIEALLGAFREVFENPERAALQEEFYEDYRRFLYQDLQAARARGDTVVIKHLQKLIEEVEAHIQGK